MTTATVDQPSPARLRPSAVGQPGIRSAGRGPVARPVRPVPMGPRLDSAVRACRVGRTTQPATTCRLTDRGIAVVLLLTAMIALAAVTVIGLTAWRVTSPGYQVSDVSQFSRR